MTVAELLSGAGYVLDTPGALLRGGIGNIGDLISGQDRTGWRASGREMLEAIGALGANKSGLDAGDVAGFLAEVLLDPMNLVPFGAAYKGGKRLATLAEKAGPRWRHTTQVLDNLDNIEKALGTDVVRKFIPPGSRQIGEGAEAYVIGTPSGRALRFATDMERQIDLPPRIAADPLLQPSHSVRLPASLDPEQPRAILENLPVVTPLDHVLAMAARDRIAKLKAGEIPPLRMEGIINRKPTGWDPDDYTMDYWINQANVLQADKDIDAARRASPGQPLSMKTPFAWRQEDFIPGAWDDLGTTSSPASLNLNDILDASGESVPYEDRARAVLQSVFRSGDNITTRLHKRARKSGFGWQDDHYGNAAIQGLHAKILDPGFMVNPDRIPLASLSEYKDIPAFTGRIADALGYTSMVRNQWDGLPWRDPTLRNALLAAPSAGFLNALHGQY